VKRSHLVFVTVVFTALLTGILVERANRDDPFDEVTFLPPSRIELEPLAFPAGEHVLAGRVLTAAGDPAEDVRVHVWRAEPVPDATERLLWDATESDGSFEIVGIPEGSYRVALLASGIPNTLLEVTIPEESGVVWTLGEPLPPMRALPEMRLADLTGRLFSPEGILRVSLPLEGYEVVFLPAEHVDPLSGAILRRVSTEVDGSFRVVGLVEADYRIQVLPPWAAGGSWPALAEIALTHRGSPEPDPLELRLQIGELTGLLVDPDGRPIEGALVRVWPEGAPGHLWPPVQTDGFGAFVVEDLPPGRYVVRIRAGEGSVERTETVEAGARTRIPFEPLETHPGE